VPVKKDELNNSINRAVFAADPVTCDVFHAGKCLWDIKGKTPVGYARCKEFQSIRLPCRFCAGFNEWEKYRERLGGDMGIIGVISGMAGLYREKMHAQNSLWENEEKYRKLFNNANDAIFLYELSEEMSGRFVEVNDVACRRLGYERDELLAMSPKDIRAEDTPGKFPSIAEELMREGSETALVAKNGFKIPVEVGSHLFVLKGKSVVLSIARDITERKRAEEALREKEERLRLITDNMADLICLVDRGYVYRWASPSHERHLGFRPDNLIGKSLLDYVHPDDLPGLLKSVESLLLKNKKEERKELRIRHANGNYMWLETCGSPVIGDNGKIAGLIFTSKDISERKKAEMKISDYQTRLRNLAAELALAEERERRRIATGIHDSIGQTLATVKMKLGKLQAGIYREKLSPSASFESLEEIRKLVEEAIEYTRTLTFELSPPVLYDMGLTAAIKWLGEQINEQSGVLVTFRDGRVLKSLDGKVSVILFKAVRELLINVAKHAGARKTLISARKTGGRLRINVVDDGIGFDASGLGANFSKGGGFGLFSIYERLKYLGGNLKVKSKPGCGTRVTLEVPLNLNKNA